MLASAPDPTRALAEQDERVLLAMLVWGEARNQPAAGQLAVAYVPLTRRSRSSTQKRATSSLSSVILASQQFSCFNASDPNFPKLLHPIEHGGTASWYRCLGAAERALSGSAPNPAPGATHYCTTALWNRAPKHPDHPQWFEAPVIAAGVTTHVATIGDHVFARTA